MTKENLQIALATQAVESIETLNKSRSLDIWEKILKSQEENDLTAKNQTKQAIPEGLSAVLIATSTIVFTIFGKKTDYISSVSQICSNGTNIWSKILDGNITSHSHKSKIEDVARDRISQTEQTTDRSINDLTEQVGRLNQKEI